MSGSNRCFLICIQVSQEAVKMVLYSHFLKNFPQFVVIHTVKGFSVVNKAEVDVFLEIACFFYDQMDVGNLISGSSAFSISNLNIWTFSVHILLKPCLENFEHYFASVWDECNCAVVWTFFLKLKKKFTVECKFKGPLGSIITNKASEGDGIPVELFQILEDDAVKVLHSICQQIWKTQQ